MRKGFYERASCETAVAVAIDLAGESPAISTGLRMFDHLLAQLALHSGLGLSVEARSLDGIEHHLIEDTGIALGRALADALDDRTGIARYGSAVLPMDDALVRAVIDVGGRSYTRINLPIAAEAVEGLEVAMVAHFFRSLASNALITLHIDLLAGEDPHHCIEAAFKAVARALAAACRPYNRVRVLTTKGVF
jgi:imidazoleglycerol-phosphate dehydratase